MKYIRVLVEIGSDRSDEDVMKDMKAVLREVEAELEWDVNVVEKMEDE